MNAPEPRLTSLSHGGGCGCKIAPGVLSEILKGTMQMPIPKELLVGIATSDDAAVYQLNEDQALIATTDFVMPIVDDPTDFGRIAATNAISDVYAMGGKPIMVNSAFRSKQVNDAVGSKDTSQHRVGCAADIRVPGMTPNDVVKAIIASDIPYDQIIREFDRWIHISVPNEPNGKPRKQALIINKQGTRPYI